MTFKITEPNSNRQIFIQLRNINRETKKAIRTAFFAIKKDLTDEARRLIKEPPKTGIVYLLRKKRGGRQFRHQASRVGESPANFTGNLSRGVGAKIRGSLQMDFGDTAKYAKFLEKGTSKIQPRPFLIAAIKNKERNTRQHFEMNLKKNLS